MPKLTGSDDPAARATQAALESRDWEALRRLLHPYLHWTQGGVTVRGRSRVLATLAEAGSPRPPDAYEVRGGQIYRWTVS